MKDVFISKDPDHPESPEVDDCEDELDQLFELWSEHPELLENIPCYDLGEIRCLHWAS